MKAWLVISILLAGACREQPRSEVDEQIARLEHQDSEQRGYAANSLGKLSKRRPDAFDFFKHPWATDPVDLTPDEARAVEALNRAVAHDPDQTVRSVAAMSLGVLRAPGRQAGLLHCVRNDRETDSTCLQALLVVADPVNLRELVDMLRWNDPDHSGRSLVAHLIGRAGPRVLPLLAEVLAEDEPHAVKSIVYRTLPQMKSKEAYELLATVLKSPTPGHRAAAAFKLGDEGVADDYRDQLEPLLADPDPEVRCVVVEALGQEHPDCHKGAPRKNLAPHGTEPAPTTGGTR